MRSPLIDKMELFKSKVRLHDELLKLGVKDIRVGHEISEFERLVSLSKKPAVGEHYRKELHILPPNKFMWVCALDEQDLPIALCAVRYDDVGHWTLGEHVRRMWPFMYRTATGQPVTMVANFGDCLDQFEGPFACVGEGWCRSDMRGAGIFPYLHRFLCLLIHEEYRPRLIFGWMRPSTVLFGQSARWGYNITYQNAHEWVEPPEANDLHNLYFVGMDAFGIQKIVRNPILPNLKEMNN